MRREVQLFASAEAMINDPAAVGLELEINQHRRTDERNVQRRTIYYRGM